jgi:hypothetical protein
VLDSTGFWVWISARTPISPRGEISQEGFVQGQVSPPATARYIGSMRIISEAPLVSEWMLVSVKKDGVGLNGCIRTINVFITSTNRKQTVGMGTGARLLVLCWLYYRSCIGNGGWAHV